MSFAKTLFTLLLISALALSFTSAESVKDFEGGPFTVSPKPSKISKRNYILLELF